MEWPFVKYQGAGNDFILMDDRTAGLEEKISEGWIAHACDRHFGIGADGLMLLQQGRDGADFFMRYYNSDGRVSSFCGNGGRCFVAYAAALQLHHGHCTFLGTDGLHEGIVFPDGLISLSMQDVLQIENVREDIFILDTGSPHYVQFVREIDPLDVRALGRAIRHSPPFQQDGINVNFVALTGEDSFSIRTYERGVEDETLACGTGVVAASMAASVFSGSMNSFWKVKAMGGDLRVEFDRAGETSFFSVKLIGPAVESFRGTLRF